MDTKEAVIQTIAETLKIDPSTITPESKLASDLMLKSANRISVSAILSSKLNVSISMFEIMKTNTVSDIIDLIEAKLK